MKMNRKLKRLWKNIIKYEYKRKSSVYETKNPPRLKTESYASLILSAVFHMGMKDNTKPRSTDMYRILS